MDREVMNIFEASQYLKCHPSTLRRLLKHGRVPGFKIGSDWRFRRDQIDKWMDEHTVKVRMGRGAAD